MSFYPPKISESFFAPRNAGKIEAPSAVGASGSFVCGAALKLFLQIEDGKIVAAKFQAAGCGFLLAAADVLCDEIENQEFAEIGRILHEEKINRDKRDETDNKNKKTSLSSLFDTDFENEFPAARRHCLELCAEALRAAINDYRAARLENWNGDEALICTCFGVAETTIETAIVKNRLTTIEEVTENCKAGGGCGSCQPLILEILDDVWRALI